MEFLFPVLAAVLQAGSLTLDKVALSFRKVNYKKYIAVSFPLLFIVNLVIFLIFRSPLNWNLFSGDLFFYLVASILLIAGTNILFYRALDADYLFEIETVALFRDIPIVLFASIAFKNERNYVIICAALAASIIMIWSHWEKGFFRIGKKTIPFFIWTFIAAPLGAILSKNLLMVWHPVSLELVRNGLIAAILTPLFWRSSKKVSGSLLFLLIITNIFTSLAWILYYFSFKLSGIIYTDLLFSIQPLLVYFSAVFFLKEPLKKKKFTAFVLIILILAAVQLAKSF